MRKALFSKASLITYLLSFSLVIYHTVTKAEIYNEFYTAYQTGEVQGNPMITAVSLYCNWLGADVTSFATSAFFFLFPIIAVMPYGWSMAGEIKSGYTKNVISRIPRKVYFFSKYFAAFVSGALAVMIPLLLSFLLMSLVLPALHMENIYPYGVIGERSMWAELYYSNPFPLQYAVCTAGRDFFGADRLYQYGFRFFYTEPGVRCPDALFPDASSGLYRYECTSGMGALAGQIFTGASSSK